MRLVYACFFTGVCLVVLLIMTTTREIITADDESIGISGATLQHHHDTHLDYFMMEQIVNAGFPSDTKLESLPDDTRQRILDAIKLCKEDAVDYSDLPPLVRHDPHRSFSEHLPFTRPAERDPAYTNVGWPVYDTLPVFEHTLLDEAPDFDHVIINQ